MLLCIHGLLTLVLMLRLTKVEGRSFVAVCVCTQLVRFPTSILFWMVGFIKDITFPLALNVCRVF